MTERRDEDRNEHEQIEALLRGVTDVDAELIEPPPDLWAGIEAELAADEPAAGRIEGDLAISEATPPDAMAQSNVIALDRGAARRSRIITLAAAAALLVVALGALTIAWRSIGPAVVASAELAYDPDAFDPAGASAEARVSLVDDGGDFTVRIDEAFLPAVQAQSADLEIWLIEPDADGAPADLVSLGVINAEDADEFAIPAGYDPDVFSVVDISIEPRDGDETHSGRSILRGALTAA